MQQIELKRGLDIPLDGEAVRTIGSVRRPKVFHIVPSHFEGITPKLNVKEGIRCWLVALFFTTRNLSK